MKKTGSRCLLWTLALLASCHVSPVWAQAIAKADQALADLFKDVIVARGKGFEISRAELDKAVITTKANRVSQGNPIPNALNAEVEAQILDKLVTTKILLLKATVEQRRKGELSARQFTQDIIRQHPSEDVFRRQLMSSGMDLEYFKTQILEQAIVKEVIDSELKADYIVPDEKARAFYETNKERFAIPERAKLQNIYIPLRNPLTGQVLPLADQTKKLTLIEEAHAKAAKGEDFTALVKQYSEDAVTKKLDGHVTIARGSNNPVLESAVFTLKPGQVSDVIKTGTGYHLVKLIERIAKEYQPFSDVSEPIKMQLEAEYIQELLPDYLTKLKQEASVEILLD